MLQSHFKPLPTDVAWGSIIPYRHWQWRHVSGKFWREWQWLNLRWVAQKSARNSKHYSVSFVNHRGYQKILEVYDEDLAKITSPRELFPQDDKLYPAKLVWGGSNPYLTPPVKWRDVAATNPTTLSIITPGRRTRRPGPSPLPPTNIRVTPPI